MVWIYGGVGFVAGSEITLLTMLFIAGRGERYEQKPHCVCDDCPHMR